MKCNLYKYTGLKLEELFWTCPECGTYLDRDENASINILNEGLKILNTKYPVGTGESLDSYSSKPIDTGLVTNLESENRNSLKTENQMSLAVD